jgi:chromosomal replication initiation ATPase DnaA
MENSPQLRCLHCPFSVPPRDEPSISACLALIEAHFGISHTDLVSDRQRTALARPRQIACWIAHKVTTASLNQIGHVVRRDHTTVLYSIQTVDKMRGSNAAFARMTDGLLSAASKNLGL